jgi:glycerol-3-phosphate dehydrogenase (NAD(P)+)
MSTQGKVAIFSAGSWGTAFSMVLADAGNEVALWARREEVAKSINEQRENPDYLPGIELSPSVSATHDAEAALAGADMVVLATPSQSLRANLVQWAPYIERDAVMVSLMKGVELGTLKRMSEVIREVAGVDESQVAVVSGPNLAKEIAVGQPTATVIACTDHDRAVDLQQACSNSYFRPYTNTDVVGCELGGACKNVIALSCGMASGLGFGDNTLATLITRGLAETARLGEALGADPMTFAGLAGLGDLVLTCTGALSRNRALGIEVGKGNTLEQALAGKDSVAEGVLNTISARALALREGVDMPIVTAVHRILFEAQPPRRAIAELMTRELRAERD